MTGPQLPTHLPVKTGTLGELVVAQWLEQRGWQLLDRQWRCRWGELDLVMGYPRQEAASGLAAIAFVEVKTRRGHNWDSNGALAITPQKQAKLWKTAQYYLGQHPSWAEVPCQFDVALVRCQTTVNSPPKMSNSVLLGDTWFCLQDYITHAFSLTD